MAQISEAVVREVVKEILAQVANGNGAAPAAPAVSSVASDYAVAAPACSW